MIDTKHENHLLQWNGSDCGAFVCICMEALVYNEYHSLRLDDIQTYQQGRLHIVGKCISES